MLVVGASSVQTLFFKFSKNGGVVQCGKANLIVELTALGAVILAIILALKQKN